MCCATSVRSCTYLLKQTLSEFYSPTTSNRCKGVLPEWDGGARVQLVARGEHGAGERTAGYLGSEGQARSAATPALHRLPQQLLQRLLHTLHVSGQPRQHAKYLRDLLLLLGNQIFILFPSF